MMKQTTPDHKKRANDVFYYLFFTFVRKHVDVPVDYMQSREVHLIVDTPKWNALIIIIEDLCLFFR